MAGLPLLSTLGELGDGAATGAAGSRRAAARRALEVLCSGSHVLAVLRSMQLSVSIQQCLPCF